MVDCPISFSTELKHMMSHCKALMSDRVVAIDKRISSHIVAISRAIDHDNNYQKHSSSCLFTDSFGRDLC